MTPLPSPFSPKVAADALQYNGILVELHIPSMGHSRPSSETVMGADKITAYDSVDADVVQSYLEFSLASLIYYAMKVDIELHKI